MTSERWRRVEELYHAALARDVRDRALFLGDACAGDDALRRDVESLLAQPASAEAFLGEPALVTAARLVSDHGRSIPAGHQIGGYRVQALLGTGGMGEVYRARDTKLGRDVAIKILLRIFTSDPERLARFEREARMLASLNHPHIGAIYGVEESAGGRALVLELVEGPTLADRLATGPIPLAESLGIARQITDALEAAHERGIVHRDLKPANIKITPDGIVKVLDFGLAKIAADDGTADRSQSPTVTGGGTREGAILGTAAYMSPEQTRGLAVDKRTDIWSFGCVLYEMLTGQAAFVGGTTADVLAGILQREPDWTRLPSKLPPGVEHGLRRCLEKDPKRRWRDIADVRVEIGEAQTSPQRGGHAPLHRRERFAWAALVLTMATAAGLAGYFYFHRTPKLTDKDTIVLADFTNTTGDPVFDGTLRQGLAIQLQQSPFLSLVSEERIQRMRHLMDQPADARLTPELARDICERTASAAVLDGSVARLGSEYVLGLRATNCRTGDVLDEEQVQAARKEDVLNALSQIASKFRTRVGESLAAVERHDTPLAEATTSSLEALKAYSEGWKVSVSTGSGAGIPLLKRAIEIDPKFAMAYAFLGRLYGDVGESVLSAESTAKAYELRNRASEAEKFFITASYDWQVTGNLERAQKTCELWAQTYPREVNAHGFLAAFITQGTAQYQRSIEEAKKALALDPDFFPGYTNLAFDYFYLDSLDEAEKALREAFERRPEIPDLLIMEYELAFLKADRTGMQRELAQAQGRSGAEDLIADHEAFVLAYSGRLQQARGRSQRAVDLAKQAGQRERAAAYETGTAVWEAFSGNTTEARRNATAALQLSKGRDVEYGAAFALALSGDFSQSRALTEDLEKRFPEDTFVKFSYAPVLRGLQALSHGEASSALELLQVAASYELGVPGSTQIVLVGALYPVYVRGEAYLAAHQGAEAAREFQKILDHAGIVYNDPIGALARLQLGRAFVLSGDKTKAKTAYQDFLTLWRDADPDIPILEQAQSEYAKLQ